MMKQTKVEPFIATKTNKETNKQKRRENVALFWQGPVFKRYYISRRRFFRQPD